MGLYYAIELDGRIVGRIFDLAGSAVGPSVVPQSAGGRGPDPRATVGAILTDTFFTSGAGMSQDFYHWIKSSLNRGPYGVSRCAVFAFDDRNDIKSRLELNDPVISEIHFPALDVTVNKDARMSVWIAPSFGAGGPLGKASLGAYRVAGGPPWRTANFRLLIDGLENESTGATRIEPLKAKLKIQSFGTGSSTQLASTGVDYTHLIVYLPSSNLKSFMNWHNRILDGEERQERTGVLELLSPGGTKLFEIDLEGLMIQTLTLPVGGGAGSAKIDMYCWSLEFSYSDKACVG